MDYTEAIVGEYWQNVASKKKINFIGAQYWNWSITYACDVQSIWTVNIQSHRVYNMVTLPACSQSDGQQQEKNKS